MGRVFHASASAERGVTGSTSKGIDGGGGASGGGSGSGGGGGGVAGSGSEAAGDVSETHPFSKTKVRGTVTLLKFAQVRAHAALYLDGSSSCFGEIGWRVLVWLTASKVALFTERYGGRYAS